MNTVTQIGDHKSGLTLEIACPCGEQHQVELDHSGHWKGMCSGRPGQVFEVQLRPQEWREIVEKQRDEVRH